MKTNISKTSIVVHAVVYAFFFFSCCYLFYMQAIGEFTSDLDVHIADAINNEISTYSFNSFLLSCVYSAAGFYGVALLEACIEIATIALSEYLLRKLCPSLTPLAALAFAVAANLAIAIFIPFIHQQLFLGMATGNKWHNSTYASMRLFALGALLGYLRIVKLIDSRYSVVSWILFAACTLAATAIKPSFYTIFAPTVFIFCVIDLMREGKSTVKRSLLLGLCLAIPLLVISTQYTLLFGNQSSGGNEIAFGIGVVWGHYNNNIPAAIIQSYAFPIAVVIGSVKQLKEDRNLAFALIMSLLGLVEYLCFYETGDRMWHGNFGWASSFGLYYLMLSSIATLINSNIPFAQQLHITSVNTETDNQQAPTASKSKLYFIFCLAIFALHVAAGALLYLLLLLGFSYAGLTFRF